AGFAKALKGTAPEQFGISAVRLDMVADRGGRHSPDIQAEGAERFGVELPCPDALPPGCLVPAAIRFSFWRACVHGAGPVMRGGLVAGAGLAPTIFRL